MQAEKEYGNPGKPLLSSGTAQDLDALLRELGYADARRLNIQPTGVEKLGSWINALSPLLLIIGALGIYVEFKTPGFGLPGIVGITAFILYFLGGYVAGLSGIEWVAVFLLGLVLFAVELFVFPGTAILGLAGALFMLVAVVMAMVDVYPATPGIPTSVQFQVPYSTIVMNLAIAMSGSLLGVWLLSSILPKTSLYHSLVSQTVSGESSVLSAEKEQERLVGQVGVTLSRLRPGGKAQFGDSILDVITQGEPLPKGARVKVVGHSGTEAVVQEAV